MEISQFMYLTFCPEFSMEAIISPSAYIVVLDWGK